MKLKTYSLLAMLIAGLIGQPVVSAQSDRTTADGILSAYEKVSTALANDDLALAIGSAHKLAQEANDGGNEAIANGARLLANSDSLDVARWHLKSFNSEVVKLAVGSDTYHVMVCPMVKARWVQSGEIVMNPYMGTKMQQCGGRMNAKAAASAGGCCSMMRQ